MIRELIAFVFALIVSVCSFAPPASAEKLDWLVGTWVLCDDPDNSPKEHLQFNEDGTGLLIRAKGNIEFLHKHSGQAVSLLANAGGRAIPIELSASSAFDALLLYSQKTGQTASYIRTDSGKTSTCSIK